ncbi:MAG TPA: RHS repeat-associated core domain-containing protein [Polyangiaceae bacterium]|nr:RHS repeat-associated core domain-containing protein [Polyangiaceae bacterium]
MLEIREDQIEAMRAAVRASIPDAVLSFMRSRSMVAHRENGAVVASDKCGQRTRVLFHPDGLPERLELPSGEHYRLESDAEGRVVAVEHSSSQRVEIDREEDRIVAVRRPGIDEHRFGYDEHGQLATIRYPDGTELGVERDPDGRLLSQTDRMGARTEYQRTGDGTLVAMRDPLGREIQYETAGGSLSAVVYPDGSREEYGFDPSLYLAALTLRNGKHVLHQLNHLGAIDRVEWPDAFLAFDYDEQGRFVGARNAESSVAFTLNENGEAIRERTADGMVKLGYDAEGRLTRLVTPHGDAIEYAYDADGRLSSVRDWEGRTQSYAYASDGTAREIRYGNGLVERQRYGTSGRLEHARVSNASAVLSEQRYGYDVCGRMTELADGDYLRKLWHDAEGRLTSSLETGNPLYRYEYDKKGNLIGDGDVAIEIGAMDEPRRFGDEAIDYDELGNVVSMPSARGRQHFRYALDGRMLETRVGERTIRYAYDALGRRVLKTDGVRSWRYGWSGHQLLWEEYQEAPGARGVRRDYLWAPDSVVPIAFREGGRSYWIQCDARGAPIRVYRQDGALSWSARYDDFGRAHEELAHVRQPWRLPGQYHDEETGLHYSIARYYSPERKIYLSRDPQWFAPGATNYSYARQSPYTYADPMGALAFLLVAVAAVAVGAAVGAIAAAVTGGDPVAGAVGGAMAVVGGIVGGLLGGPVGMVAGGMIGSTAGAFTESLIEQARNGEPLCMKCAAKAAAIALGIDIALLGLGKIPGVRRAVRAIGEKLFKQGKPMRDWAKRQLERIRPRPVPKSAAAPVPKFRDYIFKDGATHGKDKAFRNLGYGKEHSEQLADMWEKQAAEKFKNGQYTLGKADQYGQRVDIEIEVPGIGDAAGQTSHMRSGWMIQPDGTLKLNTPFSGYTR